MASSMASKQRLMSVLTGMFVMMIAALCLSFQAANANDLYTVESVPVDVTSKSAAEARPQAMASAQQKAFEILMRRMLRAEDVSRAIAIPPSVVASFVQGMSIANERTSSVRYLANMTIKFNPTKIRDFLKGRSYPYSDTLAPPVLVVPVLERDGGRYLWEQENNWYRAWAQHDLRNRLMPVILPRGSAEDQALLSRADAATVGASGISALAARYGATEALPVEAVVTPSGSGFNVAVSTPELPSGVPAFHGTYSAQSEQDLPHTFEIAASSIATHLDTWWKERTLMRLDEIGDMTVTVPLRQISDWAEVNRRLARIPLIQSSNLVALRVGSADVTLRYMGALPQLTSFLATNGLVLGEAEGKSVLMLQETATGTP